MIELAVAPRLAERTFTNSVRLRQTAPVSRRTPHEQDEGNEGNDTDHG
ncbi:MAG: hypothetical protein ACJ77E_18680 [Gaiellaceae bacterium]